MRTAFASCDVAPRQSARDYTASYIRSQPPEPRSPILTTLLFCKPFRVMSQFSPCDDKATLADFIDVPGVYPAGRLDYDSEGLLLLTDDGQLQHRIASPRFKLPKTYWAQVDGQISDAALQQLRSGLELKDGPTRPAVAKRLEEQEPWPRDPPVRYRANIPTSWISLQISEGRNRQVRRMTAAVGFPTLRLIRVAIGPLHLGHLRPGQWREVDVPQELPQLTAVKPDPATRRSPQRRQHRHRSSRRD